MCWFEWLGFKRLSCSEVGFRARISGLIIICVCVCVRVCVCVSVSVPVCAGSIMLVFRVWKQAFGFAALKGCLARLLG